MRLFFQDGYNFDCNACGRCCRGWNIHVDAQTERQLSQTSLYQAKEQELGEAPIWHEDEKVIMALRPDSEACVFLASDRLCSIHRELGGRAKPLGCQQFPFTLQPTPDGVYVGLSFYCDAVARNEGRPASVHEADLSRFLDAYDFHTVTDKDLFLEFDRPLNWESYKLVEAWVAANLQRLPNVEQALWHCVMGLCMLVARHAAVTATELSGLDRMQMPKDEVLREMEKLFTLAIVGALEMTEPGGATAITRAALSGGVIPSRTFRRAIDLGGFAAYCAAHPTPWKEQEFRRWIDHLLFRKFLAGPGPVLHNLSAMYTAWNLLHFYFYLGPYQNGAAEPSVKDAHRALDI
ncbi:MAG: YkgJ family cysteine cluster protein, partial [Candidatus Xenobia bacterium]